ncbi:MAG: hypothetical protein ABSC65_13160 [Acidobacteriaceae bacterium]|jgi:hypothetical protein
MNSKSVSAIGVGWLILGAFAVLWFCFFAWMPPQPGGPDVFVFRDAGCNWAHGDGLVAASVPHANTVRPMLFASYTPGALLLFGVAASLFGCAGPVDTFYNLALAAAAVFLLYHCFSLAVTSRWQRICAALLLGAILPTGMVAFDSDRPELPAFCLLVAILLVWRRAHSVTARSLLFAAVGLVFLIHPFAGIVGWLLLAFLLPFSEHAWTSRLQVLTVGSTLYALIVAAWLIAMWSQDHTAVHRFLQHAAGQGTGAGVVLHGAKATDEQSTPVVHNGYAVAFRQLFNPAFPASASLAISLFLSGLLVATYAFRGPGRARLLLQCAFLVFVLLIFPLAVFPAQTNYLGISRALLLAVLFIGGFPLASALRGSVAPLALILIGFVFMAPWVGLQMLQGVDARASYYSEQGQAKRVRAFFEQRGMRNPALLVDSGHYFVYKPYFPNLYNRNYLEAGDPTEQYQGLIHCYSGSRAFSRAQLPWDTTLKADEWRLIDGGEQVVRVALFGHPIMRRNWTWMCDVYARQ